MRNSLGCPTRRCFALGIAARGADGAAIGRAASLCGPLAIITNFLAITSIIRTFKRNGGTTPGDVKSADGRQLWIRADFFPAGC